MTAPKLGILAGGGDLPARVIERCKATGRDFFVLAFEGEADADVIASVPHAWIRIGAAGTGFRILRENNVTELVLAGAIRRPTVAGLRPDWRAAKFFARIGLKALGDDGLLTAVMRELETEGFKLVAVDSILDDSVIAAGPIGTCRPDEVAEADIAHGFQIAHALGALDIGQAVIVQQGLVLGVEAIEGTDELMRRCAALRREGARPVLIKCKKPGQDRRADLPTIGPNTVRLAHETGLAGIAVEAGGTLIVDRPEAARLADEFALFIVGHAAP